MNPFPTFTSWPPDYVAVFEWRQKQLLAMRADPILLYGALEYYRTRPVEFIEHWCTTYDPRNAGTDSLASMPFIMFQKQKEYILFLQQLLSVQTNGLCEKAREMGVTWISCAFSVWLWRFVPGSAAGWGSRKEQLVDKLGDPDSIFEKIRIIIKRLPPEFWPAGFDPSEHMPFMRIVNPETGATITGEAGDNIGRGGRKLIYFKDESAHYERPEKIEAALSETTRVQVDISSVNGIGNVFHRKRESGVDWSPIIGPYKHKTNVFVMDWRDDPRKDEEWYEQRKKKFQSEGLEHIFAQEIDRDYAASVEGIIIRPEWVKAAIDADKKLGFTVEGITIGALDVADEGGDRNADVFRKGPGMLHADEWGEGDTGQTTHRCLAHAEQFGALDIQYDCIGVGAGVKAEYNRLVREKLVDAKLVRMIPWAASAKPLFAEQRMIRGDAKSPLNKDFFQNLKAQGWWQLARRFERTYRAVHEDIEYDPDVLISIPSWLPKLRLLEKQLSQAIMRRSTMTMKMIVEKGPDGARSPNMADATVEAYWPTNLNRYMYNDKALG